jgi:Histidine kinase-like ATPase domain
MGGLRGLTTGTCCAWPLPADPTSAKAARQLYRDAASAVGVDAEVVYDGVMLVSELAANTLHAYEICCSRGRLLPQAAAQPELWLYLRGSGPQRELVCKVFDSLPGWKPGAAPGRSPAQAPAQAVSGRGLQVVNELSHGRWGHHLTRARLSRRRVCGKVVWFALPAWPVSGGHPGPGERGEDAAAPGAIDAMNRCRRLSAQEASRELEAMLAARGLGGRMVRADKPAEDMSVLWVSRGLTVWCGGGAVSLRTPAGDSQYWTYADLVDVTERAVSMHEEMEHRAVPA